MDSVVDCRGEWAVRLPRAPPYGKPAPFLADKAMTDMQHICRLFIVLDTIFHAFSTQKIIRVKLLVLEPECIGL
jgi:hypothetical protein